MPKKKQHIRLRIAIDDFKGIIVDPPEVVIIEGEGTVRIKRPATVSLVLYEREKPAKKRRGLNDYI